MGQFESRCSVFVSLVLVDAHMQFQSHLLLRQAELQTALTQNLTCPISHFTALPLFYFRP